VSFTSAQRSDTLVYNGSLSSKLTTVTVGTEVNMHDCTTLADTAQRYLAGQANGSVQLDGWVDVDVATSHVLFTLLNSLGTATPITFAPQGLTHGNEALVCQGNEMTFEVGTETNGVANFKMAFQPDGSVATGVSLHALTAETIDGNGTTFDRGIVTTSPNGAIANLHVTAFSGLTNCVFTIEDSANDSAWSTIGTFTTVTAAAAQTLFIAGAVRRYVRCVWNVTGTGSITFNVSLATL
jgi:hypothetical protein